MMNRIERLWERTAYVTFLYLSAPKNNKNDEDDEDDDDNNNNNNNNNLRHIPTTLNSNITAILGKQNTHATEIIIHHSPLSANE